MSEKHELKIRGFLDPFVFNTIQREYTMEGIVLGQENIKVGGQQFTLLRPGEITLIPGQRVFVTWTGTFYLQTESERQKEEALRSARIAQQTQEHIAQQEARRVFLNQVFLIFKPGPT